jgi:hypothetical protein
MMASKYPAIPPSLRRRVQQQSLILRALRQRRSLSPLADRSEVIEHGDILAFSVVRNEMERLPAFLSHYRKLGVNHFLIVDNGSTDQGLDYLAGQDDVSLWQIRASYRRARFGMDWLGWLHLRHGHGHWCLTVDPDELLVYPHCDRRPLRALTDWLDSAGRRAFPAMLLDLYARDGGNAAPGDPFGQSCWFDPANYAINRDPHFGNLWIQGGPRARCFFQDQPRAAPALNKIPLVKWHWSYAYVSSTHMLLPKSLNLLYCRHGGEMESGCLLHTKFLSGWTDKTREELTRRQHYAGGREYAAYRAGADLGLDLWCDASREYEDWRQLEDLGLMARGSWA